MVSVRLGRLVGRTHPGYIAITTHLSDDCNRTLPRGGSDVIPTSRVTNCPLRQCCLRMSVPFIESIVWCVFNACSCSTPCSGLHLPFVRTTSPFDHDCDPGRLDRLKQRLLKWLHPTSQQCYVNVNFSRQPSCILRLRALCLDCNLCLVPPS